MNSESSIKDQLDPIDVRLEGDDSKFFRLTKVESLPNSQKYALEAIAVFDFEAKEIYEFNILANDGIY